MLVEPIPTARSENSDERESWAISQCLGGQIAGSCSSGVQRLDAFADRRRVPVLFASNAGPNSHGRHKPRLCPGPLHGQRRIFLFLSAAISNGVAAFQVPIPLKSVDSSCEESPESECDNELAQPSNGNPLCSVCWWRIPTS